MVVREHAAACIAQCKLRAVRTAAVRAAVFSAPGGVAWSRVTLLAGWRSAITQWPTTSAVHLLSQSRIRNCAFPGHRQMAYSSPTNGSICGDPSATHFDKRVRPALLRPTPWLPLN